MADSERRIAYEDRPLRAKRVPPPVDGPRLLQLAQDYVGRFWGPAANLRRVLLRHAQRSVRDHGSDAVLLLHDIEEIIAMMVAAGAVNDRRFAELRAATLAERGVSQRMVAQRLGQKGVGRDDIDHALAELKDTGGDLAAASNLVRRRKLGYLREPEERKLRRDKDLAVLLRGGFGFEVAKKALAGSAED